MNTIDRRHRYGIILDTETANTIVEEDGKLNMNYVLPYDLGFAVIDTKGRIYEKYSLVIDEIFCDEFELMRSAYYSSKIPKYIRELARGDRQLVTAFQAKNLLYNKYMEYNCTFVMAHNMRFDLKACNNLQRWTTKSKYRYFFPYGCEYWDTMRMAQSVICKMPIYKKFCEKHNLITKNGQVRKTAEALYQFITKDTTFNEEHTGLEDVLIELEIYKYCLKQKKPMQKLLFNN